MKHVVNSLVAFTVVLGMAFSASAEEFSCVGMEWPDQVESMYENVAPGCIEVVEEDGTRYGVFEADFLSIKAGDVTLRFKMPEGENVIQTFHPPKDFVVKVGKRNVPFSELERGQSVILMIPEAEG